MKSAGMSPRGSVAPFKASPSILLLAVGGAFALTDLGSVVEAPGTRFGILAAALALAVPAAFVAALTLHGVPSRWLSTLSDLWPVALSEKSGHVEVLVFRVVRPEGGQWVDLGVAEVGHCFGVTTSAWRAVLPIIACTTQRRPPSVGVDLPYDPPLASPVEG
jgi:hypothetical protein